MKELIVYIARLDDGNIRAPDRTQVARKRVEQSGIGNHGCIAAVIAEHEGRLDGDLQLFNILSGFRRLIPDAIGQTGFIEQPFEAIKLLVQMPALDNPDPATAAKWIAKRELRAFAARKEK